MSIWEASEHCVRRRCQAGRCRSNEDTWSKLPAGVSQTRSSSYKGKLASMRHTTNKTLQLMRTETCYCIIIAHTVPWKPGSCDQTVLPRCSCITVWCARLTQMHMHSSHTPDRAVTWVLPGGSWLMGTLGGGERWRVSGPYGVGCTSCCPTGNPEQVSWWEETWELSDNGDWFTLLPCGAVSSSHTVGSVSGAEWGGGGREGLRTQHDDGDSLASPSDTCERSRQTIASQTTQKHNLTTMSVMTVVRDFDRL